MGRRGRKSRKLRRERDGKRLQGGLGTGEKESESEREIWGGKTRCVNQELMSTMASRDEKKHASTKFNFSCHTSLHRERDRSSPHKNDRTLTPRTCNFGTATSSLMNVMCHLSILLSRHPVHLANDTGYARTYELLEWKGEYRVQQRGERRGEKAQKYMGWDEGGEKQGRGPYLLIHTRLKLAYEARTHFKRLKSAEGGWFRSKYVAVESRSGVAESCICGNKNTSHLLATKFDRNAGKWWWWNLVSRYALPHDAE